MSLQRLLAADVSVVYHHSKRFVLLAEYFCDLSSIPVRAGCGKNVAQRLLFAKFPG
jgi:hypothetical protein